MRKIKNKDFFRKAQECLILAGLFFVPLFAQAALPAPIENLKNAITNILNPIIILLIGLAFVVFLLGVYKYISSASLEGKESGRERIIYGLIGLFVMLAAWGLVNILLGTFGFTETNTVAPPAGEIPKAFK